MATLKRTFTNRGKRALTLDELRPNGTYAVRIVLPVEEAARLGVDQEQWGLAMLGSSMTIRRTFNVENPGGWHSGFTSPDGIEFWKASKMERDYADAQEAVENLRVKNTAMMKMIAERDKKITYYETNRWHKVAERLTRFFS